MKLNLAECCESAARERRTRDQCGGTTDGINLYLDSGECYIVTPEQLREIAGVLLAAADEAEASR